MHNTETPSDIKPPHRRMRWQAPMLILLVISGLFYSAYTHHQQHNLGAALLVLQQQQADSKAAMAMTVQTTQDSQTHVNNAIQSLNKSLQTALQQQGYGASDWLMLQARHYLELAEINAHWGHDVQTTTALLQQADASLARVSDQRVFVIRQSIARAIQEQQQAPKTDIVGLLSTLDAIENAVMALPIHTVSNTPVAHTLPSAASTWRDRLHDSLQALKTLVIIEHHDTAIQPHYSAAYEAMLRRTLLLNLQETQWAVLQGNQAVYQLTLKQALDTVAHSFNNTVPQTQALMKQLQDLQNVPLVQPIPIPHEACELLNQLIDAKASRTAPLSTDGRPS